MPLTYPSSGYTCPLLSFVNNQRGRARLPVEGPICEETQIEASGKVPHVQVTQDSYLQASVNSPAFTCCSSDQAIKPQRCKVVGIVNRE